MDIKKNEILKAASSCFARYGYDKTTLEDIGRLSGLNKASLYYYYKNKETIYTEVVFKEAEQFLNEQQSLILTQNNFIDQILTYMKNRMLFIANINTLHQISQNTFSSIQLVFEKLYTAVIEKETVFLSGILDSAVQNGKALACDTRRVANSLLTAAEGAKLRSPVCRDKISESADERQKGIQTLLDEVHFISNLILNGIKK